MVPPSPEWFDQGRASSGQKPGGISRLSRMQGSLVVLTGASGSGKTTLAQALQERKVAECDVLFFDSIGVPSPEEIQSFGTGSQPGGAWQRAMTLRWMKQIAEIFQGGRSVLFEGQMRIAFVAEGIAAAGIPNARIILVDCDDATRIRRLTVDRGQPELADLSMLNWAKYLREEAEQTGCEILDTGVVPLNDCVALVSSYLPPSTLKT
jgi:GTPase SAR1 family protein